MKNKSMSRVLMVVTPILIVGTVLALGASAVAEGPGTGPCSNRSLFGDYGMLIEGTRLPENIVIRTLVMDHFDGKGTMTLVAYPVVDGVPTFPDWTPEFTAPYSVNSNCTGAAMFGPIAMHIVIVNNGKDFRGVADGSAITVVGSRVN